jgi:hypothetical protein
MIFNNLNDKFLDKVNQFSQLENNSNDFIIIPIGDNNLKTDVLYYQRKNYEIYLNKRLQDSNVDTDSFKDFRYKHNLYGKIDSFYNSITINKNSLKQINNTNFSLSNVAADALNDMLSKHKRLCETGQIDKSSIFFNLQIKKGFSSPHIEYGNYLNKYFNNFYNFVKANQVINNIIDYKTTVKYFLYYYNSNSTNLLFNKSEFIKSKLCSPYVSGLIVEFANSNHGEDYNKFANYLEDAQFIPFQNLAKEFGFTIDRHTPWRMVFDVSSPPAIKYLKDNYQIDNINQYFAGNYYLADYFDFESFKINMYNLHDFIAREIPTFKTAVFKTKNDNICVSQKLITRNRISYDKIYDFLTEEQLLKIFFYIKSKENNTIKSQNQFEQEFNEILQIYKYSNIENALETIFYKCKQNYNTGDQKLTISVI